MRFPVYSNIPSNETGMVQEAATENLQPANASAVNKPSFPDDHFHEVLVHKKYILRIFKCRYALEIYMT